MTENEAKSCIQGKLDCMNKCDVFDCKGTDECDGCNYCYAQGTFGEQKKAFETAIQALEEIQKIKEIISDFPLDCGSPVEDVREIYRQLRGFLQIGTIDEFKALKEKATPKEPIIIDNRLNEVEWKCPVCGLNVIEEPPCQEYCQRCGNKLDWSE